MIVACFDMLWTLINQDDVPGCVGEWRSQFPTFCFYVSQATSRQFKDNRGTYIQINLLDSYLATDCDGEQAIHILHSIMTRF